MRWCVVGFDIQARRYELLSEVLKEAGHKNQMEVVDISTSQFAEEFERIKGEYDQIRIEQPYRHLAFSESKIYSADMGMLRSADSCFKDKHGKWWLRSANFNGMEKMLNQMPQNLDLEGGALIVGAGGGARSAISALTKAGFRTFNVTNSFDEQAIELITELKSIYFDTSFNFISQGQLVLLPGTNSIVVNTTPFSEQNQILEELHFFNFLKIQGIVWDLTISPVQTPLVLEAEQIGATIVKGYEFAAASDVIWGRWIFPNLSIDELKYAETLKKEFDTSDQEKPVQSEVSSEEG